jgi:hypothetical protein
MIYPQWLSVQVRAESLLQMALDSHTVYMKQQEVYESGDQIRGASKTIDEEEIYQSGRRRSAMEVMSKKAEAEFDRGRLEGYISALITMSFGQGEER